MEFDSLPSHGIVTSTVLVISKIVLVTLFLFLDRTTYR